MDNPHFAYIASAFGLAALVLAGMVGTLLAQYRRLRQELARLGDDRE